MHYRNVQQLLAYFPEVGCGGFGEPYRAEIDQK
jgi:hypothetical protein